MQQPDGTIAEIPAEDAGRLRRIFAAGNREVPIFKIGEEITVSGGRFKVLAFGGRLLVLEGIALDEPRRVDETVASAARLVREVEGRG